MTDENRLVSVIIPTFNRAHVLERAVESALRQSYPHIEVIVVDDGSTDDTMERLERLRSPRLQILHAPNNGGPAHARNLGIAYSTGAFLAFLDSDDIWEPWKLEAQLACFDRGPADLGAVSCGRRIRLADGSTMEVRQKTRGHIFESLLRRNPMPLPTVMVRRAVLQDVGTFDTRLPACEDWELLLRIARRYSFDYIDGIAMLCDGAGGDRMSARARSVFIANHMIFRQYNRHSPSRATLAAYLALQSRELLHLSKYDLAGRYARASLRLSPDREERLALRTVRELMMRRPLGRVLVQAYARRHALSWRPSL